MQVKIRITVFFKESENFIFYTPALEISTYGKDIVQTQKRFTGALEVLKGMFKRDDRSVGNKCPTEEI